jgi:cytoskeletal protein CcmA (bactofilin family)
VAGGLTVGGAARFEDALTLAGGVSGNTTFSNNVQVLGSTTLAGSVNIGGNLTIQGTTRFNGPVNFGGSFSGTTAFENIVASGNLAVSGTTTFSGPVNFTGAVSGLDNLTAYVRASGETRGVTLPGLVVSGNTTIQGTLTVAQSLRNIVTDTIRVTDNVTAEANMTLQGDLEVGGNLSMARCRICINYSDVYGTNPDNHKHMCAAMVHGSSSGLLTLSGNVDDNDVFGVKFLCDGGGASSGAGWK